MTALRIIEKGETKNMISFQECYSGLNVCLMKSEFILAFERFQIWRKNNFADNFASHVFRLLCKADDNNKLKIFVGFPAETSIYLLWYLSDSEEKFFEKWSKVEIKEPEVELENGNENWKDL